MKFMLNCKETSHLLAAEEALGWRRRLQLRLHLSMCDKCSKYAEQLRILKATAQKLVAHESDAHDVEVAKIQDEVIRKYAKH